jgi:hypothetical protein
VETIVHWQETLSYSRIGCSLGSAVSKDPHFVRLLTHYIHRLASDVLYLGLTVYRGYTHSNDIPTGSLWGVLVRDGECLFQHFNEDLNFTTDSAVIRSCILRVEWHLAFDQIESQYFSVICLANLSNILMFYVRYFCASLTGIDH